MSTLHLLVKIMSSGEKLEKDIMEHAYAVCIRVYLLEITQPAQADQ